MVAQWLEINNGRRSTYYLVSFNYFNSEVINKQLEYYYYTLNFHMKSANIMLPLCGTQHYNSAIMQFSCHMR